ncbi:MAG TPA: peptide ABC transporter substrate-binding protein [Gemmatimonadales bacterium]
MSEGRAAQAAVIRRRSGTVPHLVAAALILGGCATRDREGSRPAAVVVAAVGEPATILPALAYETVARDIGDLVYERLATLERGGAPMDPTAYAPALASRWERVDSLTWRFHLRSGARWHDGVPVTADDVAFSFAAYADPAVAAGAQSLVAGRMTATAEDDSTVLVRLLAATPEPLYDITYHVRVLPRHIWDSVPRSAWATDTSTARLVGSGPYRFVAWRRGESLELAADTAGDRGLPDVRRIVWRFAADPDASLNLLLAHEADLLEAIGAPDRVARIEADSAFRVVRYPSAVYGFAGFMTAPGARRHPALRDRAVRRALVMGVDREAIARNVYGRDVTVPSAPMSGLLWVGRGDYGALPFDTAASSRLLDSAGWRTGGDGMRSRAGRALELEILVPSTSPGRRQAAIALQEMWRRIGVAGEVVAVDFPVFQERLAAGAFDVYIGAYLDEPSARGLADQWSSGGPLNHGRYRSAQVDSLLAAAAAASDTHSARRAYAQAFTALNADAPAIFLYAPLNSAAVSRRLTGLEIDPYSWLALLPEWRLPGSD